MNLYLILYGLIGLAVLFVGVSKLNGMGMTLGAGLYGVGALFLLVIYGLRWFGSENSILSNAPVPWPPVMNTCPDYLTFYKRKRADGSTEETCIDTIGVSRNGAMLQRFPSSGPAPNEDDKYFFPLKTTKADTAGRNQELCQRTILYGLTWEGITNGESCILPDGSKVSPSSGSGGSRCPV
jgi:hypothetical protein